jgi:hypothetical protein
MSYHLPSRARTIAFAASGRLAALAPHQANPTLVLADDERGKDAEVGS